MSFSTKTRPTLRFYVMITAALGTALFLVALLAPHIGLGRSEDFLFYRLVSLSRRHVAELGLVLIFWPAVVPVIGWLWPFRKRFKSWCLKMMKAFFSFSKKSFIGALNTPLKTLLLIFLNTFIMMAVALAGFEWYARAHSRPENLYANVPPSSYFRYHPYLANVCEGPLDNDGKWWDTNHKQSLPFHIKSNNLGFRVPFDFHTMDNYKKAPNERVVLIFGGSAVYGIGATSNDTTIAGYLEKELNRRQSALHYTVFNLGVNGWIAYQQMTALNLYGLNLHPDWVIFMDGNNDMINLVANDMLTDYLEEDVQSDVGLPTITPIIRNIVDGYFFRRYKPEFYRSKWENELLRRSAAYRNISGKRYIPRSQPTELPIERGWTQIDNTVDFYLRTQKAALSVCPECQYILSIQPYYSRGKKTLSKEERQKLRARIPDLKFTSKLFHAPEFEEIIMFYTLGRAKDELPGICKKAAPRCHYMAMDDIFPSKDDEKEKYLIDTVHMLDIGNERVARAYAEEILKTDR